MVGIPEELDQPEWLSFDDGPARTVRLLADDFGEEWEPDEWDCG